MKTAKNGYIIFLFGRQLPQYGVGTTIPESSRDFIKTMERFNEARYYLTWPQYLFDSVVN